GTLAGGLFTTAALVVDCTVAASFLAISTSTVVPAATPVRVGEPVTFSVDVTSAVGPPADGMVEIVASTDESCVDASPDPTPGATFACDLAFATVGTRSVTAHFSGSATHLPSSSAAIDVEVKRFADVSVTVDDGQTTWVEGEPVTYLIELRNDGPDEAPNTHLLALAMPELDDPEWECTALGGAVCPAAGGSGMIDAIVAVLPPGGGLDVLQSATVPAGWTEAVVVGVEAAVAGAFPDEVHDPDPANNLATDLDHPALVFMDGFESGDTSAWSGSAGEARAGRPE
ncbi:MAG: Ig-like domain-containing protein, partial [Chloroflexi bacterium]|nr:Ig-like domain-containing protein [Chloroflexota bacterium]